jgi:hypothetical protein
MRAARMLVIATALAVTACSDDNITESSPTTTGYRPSQSAYAVLTDHAWPLQEAIDPPADDPTVSIEVPPMEWYAEYVRSTAAESAMIRLSGHSSTFDDARSALEERGFTFDDVSLDGWRAVGGAADADPASPSVILLENGSTTLMVLSYELDLDSLATVADVVEGVDQPTWVAAGGVIQ